jgi:hypothetical protein
VDFREVRAVHPVPDHRTGVGLDETQGFAGADLEARPGQERVVTGSDVQRAGSGLETGGALQHDRSFGIREGRGRLEARQGAAREAPPTWVSQS